MSHDPHAVAELPHATMRDYVIGSCLSVVLIVIPFWLVMSGVLSGAFITFAIVIGEFTMPSLLNRPAFGPYLQLIGANRAYEPPALAVIAFAITWGCMVLLQLVSRFSKSAPSKP